MQLAQSEKAFSKKCKKTICSDVTVSVWKRKLQIIVECTTVNSETSLVHYTQHDGDVQLRL